MNIINPEPAVGQMWADNDQRTAGAGEFTIVEVTQDSVQVVRQATGRMTRIRKDRLADTSGRGYRYIGKSR